MHESKSFSLGRRRWMGAVALTAAMLASGCVIDSSNCDSGEPIYGGTGGSGGTSYTPAEQVVLATIDTDGTLETTPGEGIGAFIEYAEGGRWHVFTACDTDLSGLPCYFNVVAILAEGSSYDAVSTESLPPEVKKILLPATGAIPANRSASSAVTSAVRAPKPE